MTVEEAYIKVVAEHTGSHRKKGGWMNSILFVSIGF